MEQADKTEQACEESEPVESERMPLVNGRYTEDAFSLQDERNSEAWIHTNRPVEIRR